MSDEQIPYHFHAIRQQLTALQKTDPAAWERIDGVLEDLLVTYEQMQAQVEAIKVSQKDLLQQKQYYQRLFQSSPIAALVTDTRGLILEVNQAIGQLLKAFPNQLIGQPLGVLVAETDQSELQTHLNQVPQSGIQIWQTSLCSLAGDPLAVELHMTALGASEQQSERDTPGAIATLNIAVYLSHSPRTRVTREVTAGARPLVQHPALLSRLRVLVVDDEVDAREFIIAVLGSHGIQVRAVASAAEALKELEQFRPDVLLSDIRMPDGDGYSLIRQIRALEAEQGRHLPAAAITAYVDEDREKAIAAGFEAHLHKLAQPVDWIEMVAELAEHSSQ